MWPSGVASKITGLDKKMDLFLFEFVRYSGYFLSLLATVHKLKVRSTESCAKTDHECVTCGRMLNTGLTLLELLVALRLQFVNG